MYNIIMDSNLFPEKAQQPARYDEVQRFELDHDSTIDDVINFVVEFINSDVSLMLHSAVCTDTPFRF